MSYTITIEPSARQFSAESGETVLLAAIRQGVALPYGCQDGACGSCKCKKLSGTVEHGAFQPKALSEAEQAAGFVLTCRAQPLSDVVLESKQVGAADAFPVKKLPVRVKALQRVTDDVMIVHLQLPASDRFDYHAGQYIDVLLRDGSRRSYSMASAPHFQALAPGLELHIRHLPGGKFTDQVFGGLKEKDILRIEGPLGGFYLRPDSAKPIILLASGTGMAPIKALIEHLRLLNCERPITLYWGGRRPADLYLNDWIASQCADMPNLRYVPVVSDALPADGWSGRSGFVHLAVLADFPDLSGHQVYACGAPVVVEAARRDFAAAGLPEHEFYADAFTSERDKLGG
ncbi:2-polyprenylphenol hydroxylase and related flavodoxin oxidoreductase [Serpentinimonas maccroryi]|uniref:2-polyprenylphenol hydroxylase and related flavodoxin oxidoreductase n=1 Tax=Serpentinimonas maccroryi TaxID=1458426 RepID=A0A060NLN9_9BURK|nr:CDP-6-deoxy-delta-3,4-glucoseen reductase [Serpentinimonas maccroryi]BAO82707.1 2-polyprenylphenol hydroxylase and related flavodoxin oxidoreductase [Serpentinimonas maccroryi]